MLLSSMKKFESALIITHFMSRGSYPYDPLEGPANSVCKTLKYFCLSISFLQLPLVGFDRQITHGLFDKQTKTKIPTILGKFSSVKYIVDIFIILYYLIYYSLKNWGKKKIIIGVDPLSCLSLVFFKKILGYTLIFYSVDFNRKRFKSKVLQGFYEWANKISSKRSDQVWVVSEALKKYQEEVYNIQAMHISNAPIFDKQLFQKNKNKRTGNKLAWSGSFMTDRQFDIFFTALKSIQDIKPELEVYLVPITEHEKFEEYAKKYSLKQTKVLRMYSRAEWQQFVASCDVGVAIYDDKFDQTKFCEPLKIWDYMMCGVPFIISREPLLPIAVQESGVAFALEFKNEFPQNDSLKEFLKTENIKKLQLECIKLAKKFSIKDTIKKALDQVK